MPDVIRVTDVTKEYGTAVKTLALRGVSFRVESKEFLSIIGQSGSGKSTLLNLLGLLDTPTTGTVELLGTDVGGLSKKDRALFRNEHLGFVFQFHHLLPEFSVRENLLIPTWIGPGAMRGGRGASGAGARPSASTRARAEEILSFLGVGDVADKNAEQLSGGQKQRVAIGRALMKSPDILLADEPTGNLDSSTASSVFRLFENLVAEGKTVIMVTHDTSQAQRVHRTLLLSDGEIVNEYVARALPSLTHEQMLTATRKLTPLHFAPGAEIVQQGAPGDMFYIITRGVVEVALSRPDGADVIANTMSAGEYFGEIELVRGGRCIATVRAGPHTPVQVLALDRPTFVELLSASEQTRDAVGRVVEQRLAENLAASRRN